MSSNIATFEFKWRNELWTTSFPRHSTLLAVTQAVTDHYNLGSCKLIGLKDGKKNLNGTEDVVLSKLTLKSPHKLMVLGEKADIVSNLKQEEEEKMLKQQLFDEEDNYEEICKKQDKEVEMQEKRYTSLIRHLNPLMNLTADQRMNKLLSSCITGDYGAARNLTSPTFAEPVDLSQPMHMAVLGNRLDIVGLLFDRRASVNNVDGQTGLLTAATYGRSKILKYLVEQQRAPVGPLAPLAFHHGHLQIGAWLMTLGSAVPRETIIEQPAFKGFHRTVRWLYLNVNAFITRQALSFSISSHSLPTFTYLCEHAEADVKSEMGPLFLEACNANDVAMAQYLVVQHNVDPHERGGAALYRACGPEGTFQMVQFLVQHMHRPLSELPRHLRPVPISASLDEPRPSPDDALMVTEVPFASSSVSSSRFGDSTHAMAAPSYPTPRSLAPSASPVSSLPVPSTSIPPASKVTPSSVPSSSVGGWKPKAEFSAENPKGPLVDKSEADSPPVGGFSRTTSLADQVPLRRSASAAAAAASSSSLRRDDDVMDLSDESPDAPPTASSSLSPPSALSSLTPHALSSASSMALAPSSIVPGFSPPVSLFPTPSPLPPMMEEEETEEELDHFADGIMPAGGAMEHPAAHSMMGVMDRLRERRGRGARRRLEAWGQEEEKKKKGGVFPYVRAASESGRADSVDLVEYLLTEGADVDVEQLSQRARSIVIRALKQREEREEVANFCSTAFATGVFYTIKFPTDVVRIIMAYTIGSEGRQAYKYRQQMAAILSRAPKGMAPPPSFRDGIAGTWQEDGVDEYGQTQVTFVPAAGAEPARPMVYERKDEEDEEEKRQIEQSASNFLSHVKKKRPS